MGQRLFYATTVLSLSAWLGSAAVGELPTLRIPQRDAKARPELIDLSTNYNASLDEPWHPSGRPGNDLSRLPHGIQKLNGVEFDIRGVVQISGLGARNARGPYPKMAPIKVGLRCQELNFLHGTAFGEDEGTEVGSYVVHYADGKKEELAIIYGQDVRDWWAYPQEPQQTPRATVAWRGQNGATTAWGVSLQLFRLAWKNPRPDSVIESVDFVARPVDALPFLLAITAVTDATH